MLSFKEFRTKENRIVESKQRLQQLIIESVQQFRKEQKRYFQSKIKTPSIIILQSIEQVMRLYEADLHQTQKDKKALTKFMNDFEKLSEQEQIDLVHQLATVEDGKKYIENNNEVKLILIYNRDKNSYVGQEAYNAVIMNKEGFFQSAAHKKVAEGKMTPDQAADYVQEMFLTLCGGGEYNAQNGGLYSLDAYDPYSGVPFNAWLNEKVIPAASNKFQARYNRSIANDYMGAQDNIVISTDATRKVGEGDDKDMTELDFIPDTSANQADDNMDNNEQVQLIRKVMNDEVPQKYQLTKKQKDFIKLHFYEGLGKKEAALKLGYKLKTAAPVARLYLGSEKGEAKDGSAIKHLKRAIEYLQKNAAVENGEMSKQEQAKATEDQMKKQLLEKVLMGIDIPQEYKLTEQQIQVIKSTQLGRKKLSEIGKELGFKKQPIENAKRIKNSALSKLRKAMDYLNKQDDNI